MFKNISSTAKNFYLLLIGRLISGAGSYFNLIALNLFTLIKTGSPLLTGVGMALKILFGCIASPYLGKLADKIDRKTGMIVSDAILGMAMLLLAILPDKHIIVFIFLVQILLGIFQNFFLINFQAAMPKFSPHGNLVKANAWYQIANCSAIVCGTLGAAVLISFIGYRGAFVVDGVSYFVSLSILLLLPLLQTQEVKKPNAATDVKEGFWDGLKYLAITSPIIFFLSFIRWLDGVGSGSHNVALPIFGNLMNPGHPNRVFGLIVGVWGMGCLISSLFFTFRKAFNSFNDKAYRNIFIYSTGLMSLFWILIFQTHSLPLIIFFAVIAGVFDTTATITYSVILQKTEDAIRGRVMALSAVSLSAGLGGGMFFASFMTSIFPPNILVMFWHGIPIFVVSLFFIYSCYRLLAPKTAGDTIF